MKSLHPVALIALISALVAFGAMSIDLYTPSMPSMAVRLATDPSTVQLTMSVFLLGYAVSQLVYGPLSDRIGRRPALVWGCGIYFAASVACALAPTIEALIALRFVQAFGACSGPVVGRAIVRDLYAREDSARAFAYVGMSMMVTPIVAPIIGAWLEVSFGWRSNFAFIALFAGVMLAAVLLLVSETNAYRDPSALRPSKLARNYLTLLADGGFMGYALSLSLAMGGVFAFVTGSAFVLIDLVGVSPRGFALIFAATAVAYGAGSFASARLTPRWGLDGTIARGALCYLAGAVVLVGLPLAGVISALSICLPMTVVAFGHGLTMPNCQAGAFATYPHMAGAAAALTGFMMMAAAGIVGTIVARFYDGTPFPMVFAILGGGIALAGSFYLLVWRRAEAAG